MPNPLVEVLPAKVRRGIYAVYGLLSIAVSATQVGYAAVPGGLQPIWLTVTIAVTTFLAAPVAALAVTNTRTQQRNDVAVRANFEEE